MVISYKEGNTMCSEHIKEIAGDTEFDNVSFLHGMDNSCYVKETLPRIYENNIYVTNFYYTEHFTLLSNQSGFWAFSIYD